MCNNKDKVYLDIEKEIEINESGLYAILALPYGSNTFIGECNWLGKRIRLEISADSNNRESADNGLSILRMLISQADDFDLRSKYYVSQYFLEDANLCNPENNIAHQEFISRITLDDLGIYGDKIDVGYITDGMFDSMEDNMMIIASFKIDKDGNFLFLDANYGG